MQCNTIKHKKHKNTTPCNDKTLHKLDPVDPNNWIFDRLAKHTSYVYCLRYTTGHHHQNHPDVIDLSSIESLEGEGGSPENPSGSNFLHGSKCHYSSTYLLVTLGK